MISLPTYLDMMGQMAVSRRHSVLNSQGVEDYFRIYNSADYLYVVARGRNIFGCLGVGVVLL
jgi:hypothetical protein